MKVPPGSHYVGLTRPTSGRRLHSELRKPPLSFTQTSAIGPTFLLPHQKHPVKRLPRNLLTAVPLATTEDGLIDAKSINCLEINGGGVSSIRWGSALLTPSVGRYWGPHGPRNLRGSRLPAEVWWRGYKVVLPLWRVFFLTPAAEHVTKIQGYLTTNAENCAVPPSPPHKVQSLERQSYYALNAAMTKADYYRPHSHQGSDMNLSRDERSGKRFSK